MESEPDEELVGGSSSNRNWKGIGISLIVISVICGLICIAAYLRKQDHIVENNLKPFTFDEITDKHYEAKRFHGIWLSDTEFAYQNETMDIVTFNCTSLQTSLLVSGSLIRQFAGDKSRFWMHSNKQIILFTYDLKHLYRHSYIARYKILNRKLKMSVDIYPPGNTFISHETDYLQALSLAPNSLKLAFVQNNNIYIMDRYLDGYPIYEQITNDGEALTIYNGITDWLYEEEILYQTTAMFWSPNSNKLAYIKFNDSNVEYYTFPLYDGTLYNTMNKIRYPKPGTNNPIAKVFLYDTIKNETKGLEPPQNQGLKDYYVWNVKWLDDDKILIVYVNREQTWAINSIYNATNGRILIHEKYPPTNDGWIIPSGIISSPSNSHFYQIWPVGGYKAIVGFDTLSLIPRTFTNHKFDVTEISHLNIKEGFLYYVATNNDSRQRHLFRKSISADYSTNSECLTCNIPLASNKTCQYSSPVFFGNSEYYILECLGEDIPTIYLKSTKNKTFYHILERNNELRELLSTKILPIKRFKQIFIDNSTNTSTFAEILYPPNFSKDTAYPVLVFVYNGPTSQIVDYQFRIRKFETFICTTFNTIVAIMDGRGTDNNGDKYLKTVYKKLGEFETQDQLLLARELKKETFTDDNKFAIWGWSYGGFVAAMALFQGNEYQCAISGAPVVDWSFYDSAYTERFLGQQNESRDAYAHLFSKNKLISPEAKRFLLIHGTGDDNVHFQNSAILAKILRYTRMDFEFEVYPDIQHTPDEETQRHLYQKMSKFLMKCYNISLDSYNGFYPPLPVIEPPSKASPDDDSKS